MSSHTSTIRSKRSTRSRTSDESYASQSSAPTSYTESTRPSPRPSIQHAATTGTARSRYITYDEDLSPSTSIRERASSESYASTIPEDLYEEPESFESLSYTVPSYETTVAVEPRASNAQDFADFFPSQRRLCIRHDDTTSDGNMNLRVDTEIMEGRHRVPLTLFHLRMQDLKDRQFSLRRYCRDSGREVCHSARKYQKPASERPGIQRSMSNALASLRIKPDGPKRTNSWGSVKSAKSVKTAPVRHDSGYGSNLEDDDEDDEDVASFMSSSSSNATSVKLPTNTTKLDFSNYAQVEVKRRGGKGSKRYEFEYWGHNYTWKRMSNPDGAGKRISFHLVKEDSNNVIAHIVPEMRSPSQVRAEEEAGGWVPPCSMWISDEKVLSALTDVADVIVATGLIALVDDCIKRRFSPKHKSHSVNVPLTQRSIEYVGPKALYEAFKRRGSVEKDRDSHKESPLRRQVVTY